MARSHFGGTSTDWLLSQYKFGQQMLLTLPAAATTLKFYDAATDGTRHTDLLDANSAPTDQIQVDGFKVPDFYGPDGVLEMWADDGDTSTPRDRIVATDTVSIAAAVGDAETAATDAASSATAAAASAAAASGKVDKGSLFTSMLDYAATDTGLTAALAATATGGIVDLAGLTITLAAMVTISRKVTLRNGTLVAGAFRAIHHTAQLTLENVSVSRSTTFTSGEALANRCAIHSEAKIIMRGDYTMTNSALALVYLSNGSCNGSTIRGGTWSNSLLRKDVCAIYGAAGTAMNRDILIEDVTVANTGGQGGLVCYNPTGLTYNRNKISGCRALPDLTWNSGWTNVSGNIWSHAERSDGETNVITWNGTELTDNKTTPTTPGLNEFGHTGENGLVYVNVGANPTTGTTVSRTVSGYGLLVYGTTDCSESIANNTMSNNRVDDCDGFGIYWQVGVSVAAARRNSTHNNKLTNVALKGLQSNKLPFAGMGVIGGTEWEFSHDEINTVGTSTLTAPGLKVSPYLPDGTNPAYEMKGTITGLSVTTASRAGVQLHHGEWTASGCRVVGTLGTGTGWWITPVSNACVLSLTMAGCESSSNGGHGALIDLAGFTGAKLRVVIDGGRYFSNSLRGIQLADVSDCALLHPIVYGNTVAQQVYVSSTAGTSASSTTTRNYIAVRIPTLTTGQVGILFGATVNVENVLGPCVIDTTAGTALQFTIALRTSGVSRLFPADYLVTGSPAGVVAAAVGSRAVRTDGGTSTTLYVKETGTTTSTGWVAK